MFYEFFVELGFYENINFCTLPFYEENIRMIRNKDYEEN